MSTLSVPLTPELERFIEQMVKDGRAANKADAVRKAIRRLSEEEAIAAILTSEREIKEGKILRGDLLKLIKKIP
jgi:putative addiction module CopG family antidote